MHHHFELHLEEADEHHGELSVAGDLDIGSIAAFRSAVSELMGAGRRDVCVDLAGLDFMDSTGLGVLMWAHHRLEAAGGHLTLVNAHGNVERVLELTGTAKLLLDAPATG